MDYRGLAKCISLYRDLIKFRTKNAERQYKLFKNTLTGLIRQAKKDYFNKVL